MSEQSRADGSQDAPAPKRESPAAARRKFWNFVQNDGEERTLYLEGAIADETWWGDEVTPKLFKDDLLSGSGDITVWINSPGGDVFAAAQIYNMLKDYPSKVTVKIDGIAASAASVVAMSGDQVLMSPVSCMMIHNPATIAIGDGGEMLRAKAMLDEVKESIINAYEAKSGQTRAVISHMMNDETWMNAKKAVELRFADGILFSEAAPQDTAGGLIFSRMAVTTSLQTALDSFCRKRQKLVRSVAAPFPTKSDDSVGAPYSIIRPPKKPRVPADQLERRLKLIKR